MLWHAPLNEGKENGTQPRRERQTADRQAGYRFQFGESGRVATLSDKGYRVKIRTEQRRSKLVDVGDFEKDPELFVRRLGQSLQRLYVRQARSSLAWTTATRIAAGTFWVENGRIAANLIHQSPNNAVKVVFLQNTAVPSRTVDSCFCHPRRLRKGGRVEGIYFDGVMQPTTIDADSLRDTTIKTTVPFKVGQRHKSSRANDLSIQDLRVYNRSCSFRLGSGRHRRNDCLPYTFWGFRRPKERLPRRMNCSSIGSGFVRCRSIERHGDGFPVCVHSPSKKPSF